MYVKIYFTFFQFFLKILNLDGATYIRLLIGTSFASPNRNNISILYVRVTYFVCTCHVFCIYVPHILYVHVTYFVCTCHVFYFDRSERHALGGAQSARLYHCFAWDRARIFRRQKKKC